MWQSWENVKTYELMNCTIDKLIDFIEEKYTQEPDCRFVLNFKLENEDYLFRTTIKCHTDFYEGLVVGITPANCKGERCPVKSSKYRDFIEHMIDKERNAYHYN